MIIAVDGTASSGKGTLAKRLGVHYGLPHLDTGLLYRAVAQRMLDFRHDLDDRHQAARIAWAFTRAWLDDPRLRTGETGAAASRVAIVPDVREALRSFQKAFARQPGGAVLDGRDIGTVIAPEALVKLWITATPEVRARRRWLELTAKGESVSEDRVLAELKARDARDAPNMVAASEAVVIDTSDLSPDDVFTKAVEAVEATRR